MIGDVRRRPRARVLPGLRQPRAGHAAHRQPARRQRAPPGETVFKAFAPRAAHGGRARSARRGRRPVDQGDALGSTRRCGSRPPSIGPIDIAVVDYGMGNLRSVAKALEHVAPERDDRRHRRPGGRSARADRVVLPGPERDARLHARARRSGLRDVVLRGGARPPFLGICLGLQMLFDDSEEGPTRVPRRPAGRASCASATRRWSRRPASGSRCRTWAGARCARRARIRCGRASPTAAASISRTATIRCRPTRR